MSESQSVRFEPEFLQPDHFNAENHYAESLLVVSEFCQTES